MPTVGVSEMRKYRFEGKLFTDRPLGKLLQDGGYETATLVSAQGKSRNQMRMLVLMSTVYGRVRKD